MYGWFVNALLHLEFASGTFRAPYLSCGLLHFANQPPTYAEAGSIRLFSHSKGTGHATATRIRMLNRKTWD